MTETENKEGAAFWPEYVRAHSHPLNRRLHFVGNTNLFLWLAVALIWRRPGLLVLAVVTSYAIAWVGHFIVQKNVPLTFRRPSMSALCDMRMYLQMWSGTMDTEVARYSPESASLK
jgi:hypothetical protein